MAYSMTNDPLVEKIFSPRIDRHIVLKGKGLGLQDVLGRMFLSNNKLARQMREQPKKKVLYHGIEAFVGMWSSDIRTMIQMFADMLREANGDLALGQTVVRDEVQDRVLRSAGGEFLEFAESVRDPAAWELRLTSTKTDEHYGKHLRDVVEAFVQVSRYEMTEGLLVGNEKLRNPRQAFRLEIIDKFDPPPEVLSFLQGLVRWHIFLQDWRGKSVRGMITPRLYLNRVLLPFCNLTFSAHDNIPMTNEEFVRLLRRPETFPSYWKKKRTTRQDDSPGQMVLGTPDWPTS